MTNAVSFSGSNTGTTAEPKHGKAKKGQSNIPPERANTLTIPTFDGSEKLAIRLHLPHPEDVFQKAPKAEAPKVVDSDAEDAAPIIRFTVDGDDEDRFADIFIPNPNDQDDATRLNHGRDWSAIEDDAVHKEKFRQVLGELQSKHGHQLPVGEQDKTDEENLDAMTEALEKRKAHGDSAIKTSQEKSAKKGHLSLDA